ncbi:MAG TPA: hypothetical protein VG273_28380 [Bryobacteraceae bacterium]|jgi:hypothetical protein|nr:hypothetical protein [Bryobacteraceae bacterium]
MAEDARLDDPTILNGDRLFRRVQAQANQLVIEADGCKRPSSAVFKAPELSVNIESVMVAQGRLPEDVLAGFSGWYLTSITAGDVRGFDAERGESHPIVRDADPPNDAAHGLVLGKKSSAFANAMRRSHKWIVAPPLG